MVSHLRVHHTEYTVKGKRNNKKQTVQFKLEDVQFFKKNKAGTLVCLPRTAPAVLLLMADTDSATLKLDNKMIGWKGVCVHQEANGEQVNCPVKALACRVLHLWELNAVGKTLLSVFFHLGVRYDASGNDISKGLKLAAHTLRYPTTWRIPIKSIDTHSLRSGGTNALALSGYSDTQIQKMGWWKGATFKEYIRKELAFYSEGMTKNMK